ncbi:TPA: type I toxin-antitoxin system Ibs family toxin [Escherichia coli]|nr:type I toxin-antitoxin system Ibs family toxin [Escherichia coli]
MMKLVIILIVLLLVSCAAY